MPYIGKEPTTGNFVYADDITTSSTNTYNILVGGVAFSPESANHLIVSLNGVIQKANTSFSVSGSQITFLPSSGTLSSSDSIDFILILGTVNDVGVATTVSDSAITKNKLNLISTSGSPGLEVKGDGSSENGTIALNCSSNSHAVKISSPSHASGQSYEMILPTTNITAGKFLKVDSVSGSGATGIGQLSFADAGGTNTPNFYAYANTNFTLSSSTFHKVPFNAERFDTANGFDTSTNTYTIPEAGKYNISFQVRKNNSRTDRNLIEMRVNGSAHQNFENGSYSNYRAVSGNIIKSFSANDTINLYIYHDRGSDQTFRGSTSEEGTFFQGFKIIE